MSKKPMVRYGVSDIIVEPDQQPQKYVSVYDIDGKPLFEVEVYIIGYENKEEE